METLIKTDLKKGLHRLQIQVTTIVVLFIIILLAMPVCAENEAPTENITEQPTTPEQQQEPVQAEPILTPEPQISINLNLRYQNNLIFSNQITIPTSTLITDSSGTQHFTTSTNVLTALLATDAISDDLYVSDLIYYDAYQSFYVNCIETTATTSPLCANWNYVVNNTYPSIGMDQYILTGNENVYIYFDNPWKITASTSAFPLNTTTTLQTWRYNYNNLENEWTTDANNLVDISITNPNPTGWWDSTITVTTTITNDVGVIDYLFSSTGTFYAKIISPDWTKWSNPITLTVSDLPSTPTTIPTSTPSTDNSSQSDNSAVSGGNNNDQQPTNTTISDTDIKTTAYKILTYLKSQKDTTGKIIDGGTTDWAIISFGADGQYADELLNFTKTYNFTDASDINICAGYPRQILALLAAGIPIDNPKILDLKSKINSECYNNNLYGQNGINDDVFGVIALLAVGLGPTEPIIQTAINTIKSDQMTDGAFTWAGYAGADITGAAINALKYAETKGVSIDPNILTKAKTYLKTTQLEDGGWGSNASDPMTTAWVMMGINALSEEQSDWIKNNKNPWHVLVEKLSSNGYYECDWAPGTTEWFATKHAVPALLGKSWPIIIPSPTNEQQPAPNDNTPQTETHTSISTTSTIDFATTTIATTTIEIMTSTFVLTPTTTDMTHDIHNMTQQKITNPKSQIPNKYPISNIQYQKPEPATTPLITDHQSLISNYSASTTPVSSAKIAFATSVTAASGLGLYLAWRFLQTIV